MIEIGNADVVRHFLKAEASRPKYQCCSQQIRAWCDLPDPDLLQQAMLFMQGRPDTNPVLHYTVGEASPEVGRWFRDSVKCDQIYTCGIAPTMRSDIESVGGNMLRFALSHSAKYPEFGERPSLPQGDAAVLILIDRTKPGKNGRYELVDGAHRLVALCRAQVETVEAYIGQTLSSPRR